MRYWIGGPFPNNLTSGGVPMTRPTNMKRAEAISYVKEDPVYN